MYQILGEGVCSEQALPAEMKDVLNIFMKQAQEVNHKNKELKPWQKELLEYINNTTQRQIIWVVGKSCGEGKSWFQNYVKSLYGTSKTVSGISIRANTSLQQEFRD